MKQRFSKSFVQFIIRFRWWVLLLSLALIFLCISGAARLSISNDYRVYFDANDPALVDYEQFQDVYSKADNIIVAVFRDKETGVFEANTLSEIKGLTERYDHDDRDDRDHHDDHDDDHDDD